MVEEMIQLTMAVPLLEGGELTITSFVVHLIQHHIDKMKQVTTLRGSTFDLSTLRVIDLLENLGSYIFNPWNDMHSVYNL